MSEFKETIPAKLTKRGDVLEGVIPRQNKPNDTKLKQLRPHEWDEGLTAHVKAMADGETVKVDVVFDGEGRRKGRLAGVAPLGAVGCESDLKERYTAIREKGGFVNPYTFIPTLPRTDGEESLLPDGLGDAEPRSHARHDDTQWSGNLVLTLTTLTPLLLPTPAAEQTADEPKAVQTRQGPDELPLIHGASFKGALRSAYETITASRYGVFFEHADPLAYKNKSKKSREVEQSLHVRKGDELRNLPDGTLVYVKLDPSGNKVTEVHPVMIGRLPFAASPRELLHESLKPAQKLIQLSPADRLFGWVPAERTGVAKDYGANDGASGYRGRLRVRSITCSTQDWKPDNFPSDGVQLAPLSSPKPTQFRFYASPDPNTGKPMRRRASKTEGYAHGGGLRGRKMYRWRREAPSYWQPTVGKDDPVREYIALAGHAPSQLVHYRDWVKPGVKFQVELFLDGVSEDELGPLLWLLTQGDEAPLRLGGGKPYGFGVVKVDVDWKHTRLWDGRSVRTGWLQLDRPQPASRDQLMQLTKQFEESACGNQVLHEAIASYLKAAAPVEHRVHYPRMTKTKVTESYEWFVKNERMQKDKKEQRKDQKKPQVIEGWALPHVRDDEPRLPYLGTSNPEPTKGEANPTKPKPSRQRRPPNSTRRGR